MPNRSEQIRQAALAAAIEALTEPEERTAIVLPGRRQPELVVIDEGDSEVEDGTPAYTALGLRVDLDDMLGVVRVVLSSGEDGNPELEVSAVWANRQETAKLYDAIGRWLKERPRLARMPRGVGRDQ